MEPPPAESWWRHVPAVTAEIDCSGGRHQLSWRDGLLHVLDHDAEAEAAFEALGGEPPACLEIAAAWELPNPESACLSFLRAWVGSSSWRELSVGATLRAAQSGAIAAIRSRMSFSARSRRLVVAPTVSSAADLRRDHLRRRRLEMLPEPLMDRYALQLLYENREPRGDSLLWLIDEEAGESPPRLMDAILTAKAAPCIGASIQTWRRSVAKWQAIRCVVVDDDEPARLEGEADAGRADVTAHLPLTWLWTVWGRGVSCVDGLFALNVLEEHDADLLRVRAVRWKRLPDRRSVPVEGSATLCRAAERWSALWED